MKRRRIGLVARREMKGYIFLLPWLIGLILFFLYPLAQSLRYSLSYVTVKATGVEMQYIGMDNYRWFFFENLEFISLMADFFGEATLRLLVILIFGLIIALMLNQNIAAKGFFRTLFFLPIICVTGPVLSRLVSSGATSVPMIERYGVAAIINAVLPETAAAPLNKLFGELILVLWYSGVPILIYMTGLQKIDASIYEAALIDGAGGWVSFWKITLPALRNFILINGIYTLVYLSSNGENTLYSTIKDRMFTSPNQSYGGYGKATASAWVYTICLGLYILLIVFLCRERKASRVEVVVTREQMRVNRIHRERAKRGRA